MAKNNSPFGAKSCKKASVGQKMERFFVLVTDLRLSKIMTSGNACSTVGQRTDFEKA